MPTFMHPLIVGLGLQTALGTSVHSTWDALLAGRFITDHSRVPIEIAPGMSRIAHLATAATLECVLDAGIDPAELRNSDMPLIVGTSKGPIEQWLSASSHDSGRLQKQIDGHSRHPERSEGSLRPRQREILRCAQDGTHLLTRDTTSTGSGDESARPVGLQPTGLADLAFDVARRLGLNGPRLTLSAACASGLHALIRAGLLIGAGEAERVLVVAAESSLHAMFVANFERLGVLPPPGFGCKPFDRHRSGFVMSEAAAAVVVESPDSPQLNKRSRRPIALERFAFAGDATHLTGSDPGGKTLRHILAHVIDGRQIDLVHAHGTGTEVNDAAELSALEATLSSSFPAPALYSHKGALGHSLGASGLVSAVLNCMSHESGVIPGNVRTCRPMESTQVQISQQLTQRTISRSLAVAAGFGGAMAAICLKSSPRI